MGRGWRSMTGGGPGDPRFKGVTQEEAAQLQVSISILSHDRPIAADSEAALIDALRPDHDGLIIQDGPLSALFLPQVWEMLPDPRAFVRHLKAKARIPAEHWPPRLRARRL